MSPMYPLAHSVYPTQHACLTPPSNTNSNTDTDSDSLTPSNTSIAHGFADVMNHEFGEKGSEGRYRFITLASLFGSSCSSISSSGIGRASDQLGQAVVVPGMLGRSTTAIASSSVATITRDGALASAA